MQQPSRSPVVAYAYGVSHSFTPRLIAALCLTSGFGCGARHTGPNNTTDGAGALAATGDNPSLGAGSTSSPKPSSNEDSTDSSVNVDAAFVPVAPAPDTTFMCGSNPCACADGIDNDGDGVVDGTDQECTGPLDDDEATFATGIPGDNRDPKWQDCFFDGNSGAGDDGCRYHTDCLTGDKPADSADCALAQDCIDFCRPVTPPGCDCFGCCEVPFKGTSIGIKLSNGCSLDNLDDVGACPRCNPNPTCSNECGECELCLGKTLNDLPAWCGAGNPPATGNDGGAPSTVPNLDGGPNADLDGGTNTTTNPDPSTPDTPVNSCDTGEVCATSADCGVGNYCRLGCCIDYAPQVF